MSSSASSTSAIPIPRRTTDKTREGAGAASMGSEPGSSARYGSFESVASSSADEAKQRRRRQRRESLMSATCCAAEHTVINVGKEEAPRLISCVKASQGFDWNQEIFLPSYADYHFNDLECRQDPVQDIILTEEEVGKMFPQ
ncbi:hypothetical protein GQ44DRAFT_773041 [Phaeosphaeriaceae sp. PMI808]|nr:hypothetical protein GQ44DRAFT_773041 [Phaeosphaeriaceae sp. PMI808]